jgi:stage V sporulation protein AF
MILPTTVFDVVEEADDYNFPPITGTYLRLTRTLITMLTYFLTPTFVLFVQNPSWIPETFQFIMLKENTNIPVIWQFLILELAIDGLRLAAVNTPSMLSTPLSIMAGLVLGEFSVKSGWFNAEVMLYMAFVAIANYTQRSYELGYAVKFLRIALLILTALFELWGFIGGVALIIFLLLTNTTADEDRSYLYPLIPFNGRALLSLIVRVRKNPGSGQSDRDPGGEYRGGVRKRPRNA